MHAVGPWIGVQVRAIGAAVVAELFLLGEQLHLVAGRDREAKALAGHRMLARRDPCRVGDQTGLLEVDRELLQRGGRIDPPAHVVHARFVGLAQHDAVVVVLVPGLQEDPALLVARRFGESENVDVMLECRVHFEHTDRDVPGTQDTCECHSLLLV